MPKGGKPKVQHTPRRSRGRVPFLCRAYIHTLVDVVAVIQPGLQQRGKRLSDESGRQLTQSATAASHSSTQDSAFPVLAPQEQSRTHSLSPVRDGHDNGRRSTTLVNTSGVEQQGYITNNDEHSSGIAARVNLPTQTSVLSEPVGEELSRTQSVSPLQDVCDDTWRSETLVDSPSQNEGEDKLGAGIYDPKTATAEIRERPVLPETPYSLPVFENLRPGTPCNSGDSLTSEQELLFPSEELPKPTENDDYLHTNVQDSRAMTVNTVKADWNMENELSIMEKPDSKSDTADGERSELKDVDVDTEHAREASRLERSREEPPQPGDAGSKETHDEASMDVDLEPVPKNMRELLAWIEKREGPLDNLLLIGEQIKAGMEK
ncbi:uncharacterized protein FOMMEDRAFT_150764 [Fomitiporia mediterranea MF3/22]|uniref:uncharacterized protein n=1 Tax=Fomitiporia mediterranea (strain MF3/22) TaxID=694068 RepID=UPI00044099A8|nr:uncharacterized protein FOMMEDRAFT_150764 [Fomitiporia mediterranea MF3/22]EJD08090.1 hypothetical protein FOMMEDRAFT_150764 [Fomitiporia mediterranea MF3/22]